LFIGTILKVIKVAPDTVTGVVKSPAFKIVRFELSGAPGLNQTFGDKTKGYLLERTVDYFEDVDPLILKQHLQMSLAVHVAGFGDWPHGSKAVVEEEECVKSSSGKEEGKEKNKEDNNKGTGNVVEGGGSGSKNTGSDYEDGDKYAYDDEDWDHDWNTMVLVCSNDSCM